MNRCDICGIEIFEHDRLCERCLLALLADPETADEPIYSIALAYAGKDLCETRGQIGLMATMPQLEPGLYMIRAAGVLVADATRREDGSWIVEFYSGLVLVPGCIIV